MTTQNWPDPKRPGVPLFPDYTGQHVLQDANGGKILSLWVSNRLNNRKWDIPSFYSQEPERVARDFTYVSCEAIVLTPAQINEMLVGIDKIETEQHDPINHPSHYTTHPSGIECIQIAEHMGFNLGNAIKYIWRSDLKGNAIEDLEKAAWYIQRELKRRRSIAAERDAGGESH